MANQHTPPERPRRPDSSGEATDAGRTSGGGNLGHDQPPDVEEQTNTRNSGRNADRSRTDPVMPADDSTPNTKI
jgi:hypothetical protein